MLKRNKLTIFTILLTILVIIIVIWIFNVRIKSIEGEMDTTTSLNITYEPLNTYIMNAQLHNDYGILLEKGAQGRAKGSAVFKISENDSS